MYFDFYFASIFFLIIIISSLIVGILLLRFSHKNKLKTAFLKAELTRQKEVYPLKIKAVERFALYLERIKLGNLITRIKPVSDEIEHYKLLLNATIEQEFNHNAVQKIYVSSNCFQSIEKVTQQTIQLINDVNISDSKATPNTFNQELIKKSSALNQIINNTSALLKQELKSF